MDLFRFLNPNEPTLMENGQIVGDTISKMWVERYAEAGEFQVEAYAKTGIIDKLPRGSFVSHTGSTDIMIVENHEISDDKDKDVVVSVTGRSFETYLDNRVVGANVMFPTNSMLYEYTMDPDLSWIQAQKLIRNHIIFAWVINVEDALPNVEVMSDVTGIGTIEARTINRGSIYARALELFAVDDVGIKTIRPGAWSPAISPENTVIQIHRGSDKSAQVIFSPQSGEIARADYLWTNRKSKNVALVYGKWVDTIVYEGVIPPTGYDRRTMEVQTPDLDEAFESAPSGAERAAVVAKMQIRGKEALAKQKDVVLIKPNVSKTSQKAIFRKDYDVGDIIAVSGEYNASTKMRVSEYVEIEDTQGVSGYPTLTALKETE